MSGMGESRSELIAWVNELLQSDFTKVEQFGTGAAYCQIMDSVFGDVAMHRVKFGYPLAEYDKMSNFKILQKAMTQHGIEKKIFVEKLVNCRMQDNLEFLQWIKKWWANNYTLDTAAGAYDPVSRRSSLANTVLASSNSSSRNVSNTTASSSSASASSSRSASLLSSAAAGRRVSSTPGRYGALGGHGPGAYTGSSAAHASGSRASSTGVRKASVERRVPGGGGAAGGPGGPAANEAQKKLELLEKEMNQFQEALAVMERERDFYFGKLREIEIMAQSTREYLVSGTPATSNDDFVAFIGKIQKILYSTEEEEEENASEQGVPGDMPSTGQAPAAAGDLDAKILQEETF